MRVEPIGDKVVVKRLEAEAKSAGGILLPDAAQEKPKQGKILSVGSGRMLPNGTTAPLQVREGDRVLFTAYSGTEIEVDGQQLLIMGEEEILAVLD